MKFSGGSNIWRGLVVTRVDLCAVLAAMVIVKN